MFPKNIRIMVVDDMSAMRLRVVNQLKVMGYTNIVQAANGQEAFSMIQRYEDDRKPFDLIISDWNMPTMSGLDLLKKVKETPVLSKIPFIMVTAEGEKQQVVKAVLGGVADYLIKPVDNEIFQKKLEALGAKCFPNKAVG